jgi:hypothetical protein
MVNMKGFGHKEVKILALSCDELRGAEKTSQCHGEGYLGNL